MLSGSVTLLLFWHRSVRQRIRSDLEVHHLGHGALAGLGMEGSPRAPSCPYSFTLPPRFRIVDTAIHTFGKEAQRIRNPHHHPLAVLQRQQRIATVAGGYGNVLAEP